MFSLNSVAINPCNEVLTLSINKFFMSYMMSAVLLHKPHIINFQCDLGLIKKRDLMAFKTTFSHANTCIVGAVSLKYNGSRGANNFNRSTLYQK